MAGICPPRLLPTLSMRFLPTWPEEFARPDLSREFEFRRMREVSQVPPATMTMRALATASRRDFLSM